MNPLFGVSYYTDVVKLYILCAKHQISLERICRNQFNCVLDSIQLSEADLTELKKYGTPVLHGSLDIGFPLAQNNLGIMQHLNIGDLLINFYRDLQEGELSWITTIRNLQTLSLFVDQDSLGKLGPSSVTEFQQTLAHGLPTLNGLQIYYDFFHSGFNWSHYFPNISKLQISHCEIPPNYSVSELTVLE